MSQITTAVENIEHPGMISNLQSRGLYWLDKRIKGKGGEEL